MESRVKKAFRKSFNEDDFDFNTLRHAPNVKSGYSSIAILVISLGWVAFFTYIFMLVDASDLPSFVEASLSPDRDGIRYRALLFFTPLIFTIIGYLINRNDKSYRQALAYQEKLEEIAGSLETRVKDQTKVLEESNNAIKAEIREKSMALRSLMLLEKAFKTTQTGITIKDTDNVIQFINEADARMHGYKPSDLLGKDSKVLASGGKTRKLDLDELRKIKSWTRESVNVRKDGSSFPVLLVSDVVLDDRGDPLGTVTTCDDITDLLHLREELSRALEENKKVRKELKQTSKGDM